MAVLEARNHVLSPQLHGIHRQRRGQLVDHPLDDERRLGPARAAIGLNRGRVDVDAVDIFADGRNVVDAAQHQAVKNRRNAWRGRRQVGAHARPRGGAQAEDCPVLFRGQLHVLDVIAAVRRRDIVLAARLGPLDRPIQRHGAEHGDEISGIGRHLAAEPAADLRRDHAQLVLRHAGDRRTQEAEDVRVLRGDPEGQLTRRAAPLRQRGARLHGIRDEALLDDPLLDHDFGVREGAVDVSLREHPMKRLVLGHVGVQLRGVRFGGELRVGDRRQRFVVDVDQVEGIVGLVGRLGHHHPDDIADITDRVVGGALVAGDLQVRVGQQPGARHRLELVDFRSGVDRHHAWRGLGAAGVDADNAGVRVRAPQHRRMKHPG